MPATKTKKTKDKVVEREPVDKTVSVRRQEKFSHIPTEVLQNSSTKVGSILDGRKPLKGLTGDEEKELLSEHLGVDPDHHEFGEKTDKFWAEIGLEVPSEGTQLDVSIDENGWPNSLNDYIIYRWLKKHKAVADSKEEMQKSPLKEFYIYDPERETKKENENTKMRMEANKVVIKAIDEENNMLNMLLRLLGDQNPDRMSKEQKENKLQTIADTTPERLVKAAQDKNLETRAEIEEMVEYEVLRKEGNSYFYMDDLIGENLDEAIGFFKNKKNSSAVNDMRAKLKELKE